MTKVRDVVEMPLLKDEDASFRSAQDINCGYNDAIADIGNLPLSESKLKEAGWVKCPSVLEINLIIKHSDLIWLARQHIEEHRVEYKYGISDEKSFDLATAIHAKLMGGGG